MRVRSFVFLFCFSVGLDTLLPVCLADAPAPTLQEIIEEVRRNERLYENSEIHHRESYRIYGEPWVPNELLEYSDRGRTVLQQGMHRLEHARTQTPQDRKVQTIRTLQAFDGQKTRVFDQDAYGNIHLGRVEDWRVFKPHLIWLTWPAGQSRLSEYMAAKKETDYPITWESEREERVDGLRCYVVRFTGYSNHPTDATPITIQLLWLAKDRNYLPIKVLYYRRWIKPIDLAGPPLAVFTVDELREIAPGMWFPMRAKYLHNDERDLERGEAKLRTTTEWIVDKVDPNPKYELSFFRDIEFPPGIPVHELRDGKIVKSYISQPAGMGINQGLVWFLVVNGVLLVAVIGWLAWRRGRRSALSTGPVV